LLKQQDLLDYWTDIEIGIGDTWFQKIQEAMNTATVAIMLISAHFLTSTFIRREEIKRLLERRAEENLPIFPILVLPCDFEAVPWLAELQLRPKDEKGSVKALASYEGLPGAKVEEQLTEIVKEIRSTLKRLTSVSPQNEKPRKSQGDTTASPIVGKKETASSEVPVIEQETSRIEVVPPPMPLVSPPVPPFEEITNSIGMKLILIPAGKFLMGSESGLDNEKPVRTVIISKPFYLGKYPVTQAQWRTVMGNNPSRFQQEEKGWLFSKKKDNPNRPVECVSWEEAQEFLRRLSAREGQKPYRLPTEAEWEYACRAGSTGAYCFGDDASRLKEYAWYSENSGGATYIVGQLRPNAWGLYDMHGNVWEWVQDWYVGAYYQQRPDPDRDPQGPDVGEYRVLRGGSWNYGARDVRVADRYRFVLGVRYDDIGFRCAQ
jgi:formylglycine-generating enzyme required for sulfatase activity